MINTMRVPTMAILFVLGVTVATLCGGCTTTEEQPPTATDLYTFDRSAVNEPDIVGLDRVTGARGEHLGWVRTERAGDAGGSYQVYLDPDMRTVGYNVHHGRHFRPNGSKLESVGTYDQSRGLGETFGKRAEDIVVTPVGRHELAASGPLSPRAAPVELGGSGASDDDE